MRDKLEDSLPSIPKQTSHGMEEIDMVLLNVLPWFLFYTCCFKSINLLTKKGIDFKLTVVFNVKKVWKGVKEEF